MKRLLVTNLGAPGSGKRSPAFRPFPEGSFYSHDKIYMSLFGIRLTPFGVYIPLILSALILSGVFIATEVGLEVIVSCFALG